MRHVTVYTSDKEYSHFLELAKNLHYVKKIETDNDESSKQEILEGIRQGLKDVKLIQEGKLKATSLKEFLDEL
jgi:hypothetical protein